MLSTRSNKSVPFRTTRAVPSVVPSAVPRGAAAPLVGANKASTPGALVASKISRTRLAFVAENAAKKSAAQLQKEAERARLNKQKAELLSRIIRQRRQGVNK